MEYFIKSVKFMNLKSSLVPYDLYALMSKNLQVHCYLCDFSALPVNPYGGLGRSTQGMMSPMSGTGCEYECSYSIIICTAHTYNVYICCMVQYKLLRMGGEGEGEGCVVTCEGVACCGGRKE